MATRRCRAGLYQRVAIHTASNAVRFPSCSDYVRIQLAATPLAGVIAEQDAGRRDRLVAALVGDLEAALAPYLGDDGVTFPQEVRVVLARS